MENLRMLNDCVLIEPINAEGFCERAGGLVVAKRNWEPRLAYVRAVGNGHLTLKGKGRVPLWVHVGDVVVYGNMAGQEVILADGSKCRIVREADLVAVWDGRVPAVHAAAFETCQVAAVH